MTVLGTSALSTTVHAAYQNTYMDTLLKEAVWTKLVKWMGKSGLYPLKGSTISFAMPDEMAKITSNASETSDATPIADATASEVAVTIIERLNAVQKTFLVEKVSYLPVGEMVAKQVAQNQVASLDWMVREAINQNSLYMRIANVTRALCGTTSHSPTYAGIASLVSMAQSMGSPSFDDGTYATIVAPQGAAMLRAMTEVVAVGEYSDPSMIYLGTGSIQGKRFPREAFQVAGLRVIVHPWGKLFLGAGLPDHAATTLDGGHAVGATTVNVTSSSGWAVGEYMTIGTLESAATSRPDTEQVLITAINTNAITILGGGPSFGLKYAHLTGVSVIVAQNVFAVPVLGPSSIVGYYDNELGPEGEQDVHPHEAVVNGRFWDYTWRWVGGVRIVDKHIVRGEYATSLGHIGT